LAWAETTLTGKPYVWGGTWPQSGGADCDGLFVAAWAHVGVTLIRPTETTYREWPCDDRALPNEPGDGLFIQGDPSEANPGHVMMYAKPGWVFEAEETGTLIGLKPFNTDAWEFRTRPSLALPIATQFPTPLQLERAKLVKLLNPAEATMAINNGWPIFIWTGTQFEPAPASHPANPTEYADADYPNPRP
jgi:hypothetical protein